MNNYFPRVKRDNNTESPADFLNKRVRLEVNQLSENNCGNSKCENCKKLEKIIDAYKKENIELSNDNKQLKKMFNKSNQINLEKDVLICRLKNEENKNYSGTVFSEFGDIFEDTELKTLRSISASSHRDSTFILNVIRILYKNNSAILSSRTAFNKTANKQPVTPEKKVIINKLYKERLKSLNLNAAEYTVRYSKMNEYMMNGIKNEANKMKTGAASSTKQSSRGPEFDEI